MKNDFTLETIDHCVLCPEAAVHSDARFRVLLGLVDPYDVKQCTSCGLRWLSPRPNAQGYEELYSYESYFEGDRVVELYSILAAQRAPYFADRIRRIEAYFPSGEKLNILEIGSATGEFAHEALTRNHDIVGLELSAGARNVARERYGIQLENVELGALTDNETYDVIHMNHVFEHMLDPVAVLQDCRRLLKEQGLIVLEVPQQFDNDLDRLKRVLGMAKTPRFDTYSLHHSYFYTPETISNLLTRNAFAIDHLCTANPARTPLKPFTLINLILRGYLELSDRIHRGGNIIEVFALKQH